MLVAVSCGEEYGRVEDDGEEWTGDEVSPEVLKVNEFVYAYTYNYYLWSETVDWRIMYPDRESDPYVFFDKMKYKDDEWSLLTDDLGEMQNQIDGNVTSFGYTLVFGQYTDSEDLFAIILYVYPGTPADKAGLKRGDFLIGIDGAYITRDNYMQLYNASTLLLTRATYSDDYGLDVDPAMLLISAEQVYQNPILKDTVIVKGANRIGYLSYSDYTLASEADLQHVFSNFKSKGVTDVVLDLRYNSGGYVRTMSVLVSILAPLQAVKSKQVYLRQIWNPLIAAEYEKQGEDLTERFTDTLSVNMDLNRLYVLTSEYSASASESTIVGLRPYLNVVQIGDTTYGKYCAGALFNALAYSNNKWVEDESIANWGMYLMIYRIANVRDEESFMGGLAPDIIAEEDYLSLYPWGDERDPLLGQAIGEITGVPYTEIRSERASLPYVIRRDLRIGKAKDGMLITDVKSAVQKADD
jgi:C-terminal processing protease CtpA/Prc